MLGLRNERESAKSCHRRCDLNLAYFGVEFAAAFVTAYALSGWPDLIVGLGIAAMNSDAAREVWSAAREEHRVANS